LLAVATVACAVAAPAQSTVVQDARTMRALVSATRAQHGLRPLRFSPLLDRSALLKAEAIRRCGSLSHTPCGTPVTRTFQQVGYRYASIGENLAWGTGTLASPQSIVNAWLTSPGHRANLLNTRWRDAGLAVVDAPSFAGNTRVRIWVLQFGRR
jgi:uncharacterized protein YkwD